MANPCFLRERSTFLECFDGGAPTRRAESWPPNMSGVSPPVLVFYQPAPMKYPGAALSRNEDDSTNAPGIPSLSERPSEASAGSPPPHTGGQWPMGAKLHSQPISMAEVATASTRPHTGGQWSVGAELHWKSECQPCIHAWKPDGCSNGINCLFCHLCEDGKFQEAKNAKKARRR